MRKYATAFCILILLGCGGVTKTTPTGPPLPTPTPTPTATPTPTPGPTPTPTPNPNCNNDGLCSVNENQINCPTDCGCPAPGITQAFGTNDSQATATPVSRGTTITAGLPIGKHAWYSYSYDGRPFRIFLNKFNDRSLAVNVYAGLSDGTTIPFVGGCSTLYAGNHPFPFECTFSQCVASDFTADCPLPPRSLGINATTIFFELFHYNGEVQTATDYTLTVSVEECGG